MTQPTTGSPEPREGTAARFLKTRIQLAAWAFVSTLLASACLVIAVVAIVSIPLTIVWAGIPLLLGAAIAARPIAELTRHRIAPLIGHRIESPYLPASSGSMLARWRVLLTDGATLRDLVWVCLNGTVGLGLAIVGIVEAVLDLLLWWLPPGISMRVHALLASALLAPTDSTALAHRVQQLAETRADQADMSAAELRRIERDLHDGAQARLVSLGINLALAEEKLASDPDGAKALLQ